MFEARPKRCVITPARPMPGAARLGLATLAGLAGLASHHLTFHPACRIGATVVSGTIPSVPNDWRTVSAT